MASLYVNNDRIYLQYMELLPSGKRKKRQEALGLPNNTLGWRKAELLKAEKEEELSRPKPVLSSNYPLRSALSDFLKVKKTYTKRNRLRMIQLIDDFIEVNGELFCAEVNEDHVADYLESISDLAQNTQAVNFSFLRSMFNWLKKKRYVSENHFHPMRSEPRRIKPIPDEVFEEILNRCTNDQQRDFLRFLWLTGFRRKEALTLRWNEIDFEEGVIYVKNKMTKKTETFPIYDEVRKLLKRRQKHSNGSVFGYTEGSQIEFWKRIKGEMGHDFVLHDIRKTFASKLVDNGVNIYDTKNLLRHASVVTTEKYYAKVSRSRIGKEAERVFGKKKQELKIVNIK